jgi:S1/P1 Nuclease
VDTELDNPNLATACFNFPQLGAGQAASAGPAQDCVVDKITEFTAELSDPSTPQAEQILALKFFIHFVGDVHQPLHASDHEDKGGNCIGLDKSSDYSSTNLHAYWDTGVFKSLGTSPTAIAKTLNAGISASKAKTWSAGDAKAWAMDAFEISQKDVYKLASLPTCAAPGKISLSAAYEKAALADAKIQLQKAGVRMAWVLNRALGS